LLKKRADELPRECHRNLPIIGRVAAEIDGMTEICRGPDSRFRQLACELDTCTIGIERWVARDRLDDDAFQLDLPSRKSIENLVASFPVGSTLRVEAGLNRSVA